MNKNKMAKYPEGGLLNGGGGGTNTAYRDPYYESSAMLLHYKTILNNKLKAKNPKGYQQFFTDLVGHRRAGDMKAADRYVQESQFNDYLTPDEVKSTLGEEDYGRYLNSLKTVNTYNVQQGLQPLYGTIEGEKDINNLNYGRRFASLMVNPSLVSTVQGTQKKYTRNYTYNPQKKTVEFVEEGDLSLRPAYVRPPESETSVVKGMKYGGKVPAKPYKPKKYPFGTDDPIDPDDPFTNPKSVGANLWNITSNSPVNPNAQQAFKTDQTPGTAVNQGNIIPLTQFFENSTDMFGNIVPQGTGRYVNEQGQVNTVDDQQVRNNEISAKNKQNAERLAGKMTDVEMVAAGSITAINAFLERKNGSQNKRTDRRKAIMQQVSAPVLNPYLEGTGSQAIMKKGGRLMENIPGDKLGVETLAGGKSKAISSSDHSNPMIEFTGKEHSEGGIAIKYGKSIAEVENKEVGWIDDEGGLNIFGKLKLPGTNQTFRKTAKNIAEQEAKVDGNKSKYLNILNNANDVDPYHETAISTAKVMFKSLDKQSKKIAEEKEALSSYQELILSLVDEGKANKYALGGEIDGEGEETGIRKAELKKNFTKNGRNLKNIKGVILHKTAGDTTATNIIAGWNAGGREASADFIIDKDGTITQVGELSDTKWHAGVRGVNQTALGVEIVGASSDESDMTDAQYKALQKLHNEVFAPMGITANDYMGHTQVNKKKGFDFAKSDSIKNVLQKSGIANSYDPNQGNFIKSALSTSLSTTLSGNIMTGDPYPKTFRQFKDKSGKQYQSPQGLSPAAFYRDPEVIKKLKEDKTFPSADDSNWGIEHDRLWNSLSQEKKNELLNKSSQTAPTSTTTQNDGFVPKYVPIRNNTGGAIETPYGAARREPTPFSDKTRMGLGSRERGALSPLAIEQIAPELLAIATNQRDPVAQLSYQPELKQTFDISYQLGRNENQSSFNQVAKIAEMTGNVDALSQMAAQKYKADEQYNMQEVQGNASQKLGVYGQNIDTLNDAKVKNLALIADQQVKQAQADFNTRRQDMAAITSMSGKVLQNQLENRTYNAYANLFQHYGFDKNGNVTFNPDKVAQRFTAGEAQAFGLMSAQQGANAILNGDFSRRFTRVKNEGGGTTTTETLGTNKQIQEKYKALKAQGFDDGIIGNMLRAEFPETIRMDD